MDTRSPDQPNTATEYFSEVFFDTVAHCVDFGDIAVEDATVRDRIVRATLLECRINALKLVYAHLGLGEKDASLLIERIETAADCVFYHTGFRPALPRPCNVSAQQDALSNHPKSPRLLPGT